MKESVKIRLLCGVLASFLLLPSLTPSASIIKKKPKTVCTSKECKSAAKILENSMDTVINPCDNFYQYACGNWPKNHENTHFPLPASSFQVRSDQNEEEILHFLTQKNNPEEPESVHKARKLYSMCLYRKSHSEIELLKQLLSKIGLPIVPFSTNENPEFDYVRVLAKATKLAGIKPFFNVAVDVNPYNHSLNAIWLSKPSSHTDPTSMPLTNDEEVIETEAEPIKQTDFMEKVFKKMCTVATLGSSTCTPKDSNFTANILNQATDREILLRKARARFNTSSFLPNTYTLEELQNMSDNIAAEVESSIPKLNWTKYIEEIFNDSENLIRVDLRNASKVQIVVHEMDFIKDMIKFLNERSIKEIELDLWWNVVSTLLPYADSEIFQANNNVDFPTSREKRCYQIVSHSFSMALSYMYLKKEKYNKAKIEIETMMKHIKESYKKIFQQAPWTDQRTRENLLMKLVSMKSLIAYPNSTELSQILDETYGNVKITRGFLTTMITKYQNEIKNNLNKLNQINNSTSPNWLLAPTLVNAFYNFLENTIIIPAAILGPPLYIDSLKSLIYGAIGSVVGHELSHGFDHHGRKFNSEGVLENWWNTETLVKYEEKSVCFLKAYDKYNSTFEGIDLKINSTVTLAEDISDNIGFKGALFAYRNYVLEKGEELALRNFENFTSEQLFTLGFANIWCEGPTIIEPFLAPFLDHSPNEVRVNGVLKNSREFSSIWNCPKGANMNPSDEKCSLW